MSDEAANSESSDRLEKRLLIALIAANALLRLIAAAVLPLLNEEAYYWEWSRFPSPGYLDHPPLIAWLIRAATGLAPDGGRLIVRAPSWLLGLGSQWLVYELARAVCASRRVARRALLVYLGLPLPSAVGVLMVTEAPQVFFTLLALTLLAKACRDGQLWRWMAAGAAYGLALLSNFIAVLLAPAIAFAPVSQSDSTPRNTRAGKAVALLTAAVVVAPFLAWNARHGWPTFRLELFYRHAGEIEWGLRRPAEWLFEQLVNAGPLLILPLFGVLFLRRAVRSAASAAPVASVFRRGAQIILVAFLIVGSVVQTHPNWTLLAYPSAAILLAFEWLGDAPTMPPRRGRWVLASAVFVQILLLAGIAFLLAIVELQRAPNGPKGSKTALAAGRLLGWPTLAAELDRRLSREKSREGGPPLLFATDYRYSSELSFERRRLPIDPGVVVNLGPYVRERPQPGDGQIYYRPLTLLGGRGGLLLVPAGESEKYVARLLSLFDFTEDLEPVRLRVYSRVISEYRLFRVRGLRPRAPYSPADHPPGSTTPFP